MLGSTEEDDQSGLSSPLFFSLPFFFSLVDHEEDNVEHHPDYVQEDYDGDVEVEEGCGHEDHNGWPKFL